MRFRILATTVMILVAVCTHEETDKGEFKGGIVY